MSTAVQGHRDDVPPSEPASRRWTRLGTLTAAAHVYYEAASGVAMPGASWLGIAPVATAVTTIGVAAYRAAARCPPAWDPVFSVLNGMYLSAVIGHFTAWPRTTRYGVPWLTSCEGLAGAPIVPYNVILHASFVAAVGGLLENRRAGLLGLAVPPLLVPLLLPAQRAEFARLTRQAQERPRWWNRRLA